MPILISDHWLWAGAVLDTVEYGVWHVLKVALACYWAGPGPRWSQGKVWLVVGRLGLRAMGLLFSASGVCPLVGEAGLEASAGSLVGRAGACSLGGEAGS